MIITVIGTGYAGLANGTCLAEISNMVLCLALDPTKIETLKSAGIPICEPWAMRGMGFDYLPIGRQ
ncbi:MAG: UDPglucose 6-dehydrogenase [Pseudomonadota bacterium]|nr:UDPglucose 6-dehydrogenase [Pseudomonadota bacterium]